MENPVLLHMHLFKNAGSTVDYALKRSFGDRLCLFDDFSDPWNVFSAKDLEKFLAEHPEARAVSSHQMRFPLPEGRDLRTMAFFRHPIDRAFSVYYFEKRQGESTGKGTKASESTMTEYFAWRIGMSEVSVVTNFQAEFFSWGTTGTGGLMKDPEKHLEAARERMRDCSVLGVVERLDESLVLAEHVLKPVFPDLDMAYVPQNVTKGRAATIEDRIETGRERAGDEMFHRICKLNELDMELHRYAGELLDSRISEIPDFDARLEAFRERCGGLVGGKGKGLFKRYLKRLIKS